MLDPIVPTVPIIDAQVDADRADPVDELLDAAERVGMAPATFVYTLLAVLRRLAAEGRIAQDAVQGVADELAQAVRWRAAR
jgi:hypothetical protein